MGIESQLKIEIDQAGKELDQLQRLYNVYFQGGEEDPPLPQRKKLDATIVSIKAKVINSNNATERFKANALVSRYQTLTIKWDKHIKGIENGSIPRPKNRD